MSKRNGHVNGFGLSDGDDSDPSSEEEEEGEELEEEEKEEGIVDDKDTHLNGHSTDDDEEADKDDGIEDEEDHDDDDQDDNEDDDDSDSDSAPEDISFKSGRDAFQQQTQQQQEQIEKTLSAAKGTCTEMELEGKTRGLYGSREVDGMITRSHGDDGPVAACYDY